MDRASSCSAFLPTMLTGVVHMSVRQPQLLSRRETPPVVFFRTVFLTHTASLMQYFSVGSFQRMKALTFGLTLVRHGETRYNKEGLLQGQAIDCPLSETGLQQAEAAGCYLKDVTFSCVFVSDMLRAQQTAATIMKRNSSCSALQMVRDPLLKEISFGVAEGGRLQDVKEMAKAAGQSFPGFTPPGGETQEQVKERVKEFMEKMLQQIGTEHDRWEDETSISAIPETSPVEGKADDGVRDIPIHALVVTHGAYMCVAVRYFVEELHCALPPGSDRAHMFSLSPNTGLCRFILTMRKEQDGFKVSRMSCVFIHRGDHVKQ
ncbi:putative fructose-2,6-bisphosphatase TIGAR A isoform X1 [Sparus aurata]|uniref:putative fructose-2,6-bisphosphatase TIGAR A isoform X1 n=1 Tax=Sparus aurata TaxID=8175 RepID=UPI0011C116A8|nr:probable fructose-2,6-bisphosphatase TIGAR A isoform X1 [Sparus aurata]